MGDIGRVRHVYDVLAMDGSAYPTRPTVPAPAATFPQPGEPPLPPPEPVPAPEPVPNPQPAPQPPSDPAR